MSPTGGLSDELQKLDLSIEDGTNDEREQQIRNENRLCFLRLLPLTQEFEYCHGPLTIYAKNFAPRGLAMNCQLKFAYADGELGYFTVNLANHRSAIHLAREILGKWSEIPIQYETIVQDVHMLQDLLRYQLSDLLSHGKLLGDAESYVMSPAEEKAALELLKDPNLFDRIDEMMDELGLIREFENRMTIYLTYTSRLLNEPSIPVNVIVKGDSAAGKSYLARKILNLFPPESYIELTDVTPQSFYYLPKEGLVHKILVVHERPGTSKADYAMRVLQSEQKLVIQTTVKNPTSGEFESRRLEVLGPTAFLTTTTAPSIDPENESRNLMVYTDDSTAQTKRIQQQLIDMRNTRKMPDIDRLQLWRNAQRLLKPITFELPHEMGSKIAEKFPSTPLRSRRDFQKLLDLIGTITMLFQYQRKHVMRDGIEKIIVDPADYGYAMAFIGQSLVRTLGEIPPKTQAILECCRRLLEQKPEVDTSEDPFAETGPRVLKWADVYQEMKTDRVTTMRWGKLAFDKGILTTVNSGRGGHGGHGEATTFIYNEEMHIMCTLAIATEILVDWTPSSRVSKWIRKTYQNITAGVEKPIDSGRIDLFNQKHLD